MDEQISTTSRFCRNPVKKPESDNLQIESNDLENNDLESEVQLKSTLVIV